MSKSEAWNKVKKMASDLVEEKRKEFEKYFDDENLITLCRECHIGLDTSLSRVHTSGSCMMVKRSVRQWLKDCYGSHYLKELEKIYGKKWVLRRLWGNIRWKTGGISANLGLNAYVSSD